MTHDAVPIQPRWLIMRSSLVEDSCSLWHQGKDEGAKGKQPWPDHCMFPYFRPARMPQKLTVASARMFKGPWHRYGTFRLMPACRRPSSPSHFKRT